MSTFDPAAYGPVFGPLLATDRRRRLDAGQPNSRVKSALQAMTLDSAFAHAMSASARGRLAEEDMAACCLAGVWLLHDFLDESHAISQNINTPSGSFWHGIMHRREGDFGNAKYWFRHVGSHPAHETIGQRAAELAAARGDEAAIKKLTNAGAWDPFAFVDLCQDATRGNFAALDLCLDIQQAEWEALFDYCFREAIG